MNFSRFRQSFRSDFLSGFGYVISLCWSITNLNPVQPIWCIRYEIVNRSWWTSSFYLYQFWELTLFPRGCIKRMDQLDSQRNIRGWMQKSCRWWRVIRWSSCWKKPPIVCCSRIVGGIISSITAICFPETSAKVDPAPTSSPYRFNSSVREKMK